MNNIYLSIYLLLSPTPTQIRDYYEYYYKIHGMMGEDDDWMHHLPSDMHAQVLESRFAVMIKKVKLFQNRYYYLLKCVFV